MLAGRGAEPGPRGRYLLKHTTATVRAVLDTIHHTLEVERLDERAGADCLTRNEIGRVTLRTSDQLYFDPYAENRTTGSFILIDEATNETVGAGMIDGVTGCVRRTSCGRRARSRASGAGRRSAGRARPCGSRACPSSGKSTVAAAVEARLLAEGRAAYVLDGDNLRHGLNGNLGFSPEDRAENVRRTAEVAALMADAGVVALASLVSPFRADRAAARAAHESRGLRFLEVWVSTPLEECEQRDTKGLYAKARAGEIPDFTGVGQPYEEPEAPDLEVRFGEDLAESADARADGAQRSQVRMIALVKPIP